MKAEAQFDLIAKEYSGKENCELGKMMSSPGLKYKNKVFAFFWKDQMGFKLGKDYDIAAHGVRKWEFLSPFKTKPPLKAWYIVPHQEGKIWSELTDVAFSAIKKELK